MTSPEIPPMPEPAGGWHSWWLRGRGQRAWVRDWDTESRKRAAEQTAEERAAGRAQEPMSWPMRLLSALVAVIVLAVAAVIAAVVVGAQVEFYVGKLGEHRNVSLDALGLPQLDLATFTPLATEGLVWAFTLLAVVMVLLNRTSALWTQAMWLFAGIAAFVNTWHMVSEQGDLFGGVLRGGLSVAGPFLVHLFILWCRHLRTGKTLEQSRADMEIKWQKIARNVGGALFLLLSHVRHPRIALFAFGYWTGVDGWGYRRSWRAASIDYRQDIQATLNEAAAKAADRFSAASPIEVPAAETQAADVNGSAPVVVEDETLAAGTVAVAERPAFDPAEIDEFINAMNAPSAAWDIWADQQKHAADDSGREAAETPESTRPNTRGKAAERRPGTTTQAAETDTHSGRRRSSRALRPRAVKRPKRPVAGASQAADVDVADILPAARKVAAELGDKLSRDALLAGLRGAGVSVGGRRKKAVYDAVRAEREAGSTGE